MQHNDILFYIDIGCEFQVEGKERLKEIVECVRQNEIMGVIVGNGSAIEKHWTKANIFKHFGVLNNANITDTSQVASGFIMMVKTDKTISIMQNWFNTIYSYPHLVDDSPSDIPNDENFVENRHDQSIWSIMNKMNNLQNFTNFEIYKTGIESYKYPIVTTRNKVIFDKVIFDNIKPYALKPISRLLGVYGKLHFRSSTRKFARSLNAFVKGLMKE